MKLCKDKTFVRYCRYKKHVLYPGAFYYLYAGRGIISFDNTSFAIKNNQAAAAFCGIFSYGNLPVRADGGIKIPVSGCNRPYLSVFYEPEV